MAFTEFSLSRPSRRTRALLLRRATLLQSVQGARGAHARRENKTPPPPRERISRYAALPEKGIDHTAGWTKMKNLGSVGTQEVAAGPAAVAAPSDGNQSRSITRLLVFLTESLERHAGHYRRIYSRSLNLFKIETVFFCFQRKERLLRIRAKMVEILFSSFNKKMKMTIILQMLTQYSFYLIY